MKPPLRRAIGIVRVSQVNGREGESFASPGEQRDRIEAACEREGLRLVEVVEELDVSGGTALDRRAGLRGAVEAIENGRAGVLVAAYFDRLFRSLSTLAEVTERVEAAGGQVLTVDVGQVTNGSAGQWMSGRILGTVSEYQRRSTAERTAAAQARAVARGVVPWSKIAPGYVRGDDGVLVPEPATARAVVEAFRLRADGATIEVVRAHLAAHGVKRSPNGTRTLLGSRVVLGEIHFGELVNLEAHPAIVNREVWKRVQRVSLPRGRSPKSERLLARLGVLRCAACDGRMVVGTQTQGDRSYPFYRCGHAREDCDDRVTIAAEKIEALVVDAVRAALSDAEGRASAQTNVRDAEAALEAAQSALDSALRVFAGFEDEAGARDRLGELRRQRDEAQARVEQLGGQRASITITASTDWERLTTDEQRALIRATVARVTVGPGRRDERVTIQLFTE